MKLIDLLYPPRCLFCGKIIHSGYACNECVSGIKLCTGKICRRCGAEKDSCVCTAIVNHYDGCVSAFYYADAGKRLVQRCKNAANPQSIALACGFMVSAYRRYYAKLLPDIVTSVPRSLLKTVSKGENHSAALASAVAKELSLPVNHHILIKKNSISAQKTKNRLQRLENICDQYRVFRRSVIVGKRVLLVDDVKTTGATLNECARLLKKAGAASVYCLTLAVSQKVKPIDNTSLNDV